jgi:hypothetical protein
MRLLSDAILLAVCLAVGSLGIAAGTTRAEDSGAVTLVVGAIGDETFQGKGTDATFPKKLDVRFGSEATTMLALGSGVRKKMFFKVYEAVSYAEESAGLNADPYAALLGSSVATRMVMYFLRDVEGVKIEKAWQDAFDKYLAEADSSLVQADASTFLAFFAGTDLTKGQTIELTWVPGYGLFTTVAGESKPALNNQKLAWAVFSNWYSDKPISKGLKKDLIRFLSK